MDCNWKRVNRATYRHLDTHKYLFLVSPTASLERFNFPSSGCLPFLRKVGCLHKVSSLRGCVSAVFKYPISDVSRSLFVCSLKGFHLNKLNLNGGGAWSVDAKLECYAKIATLCVQLELLEEELSCSGKDPMGLSEGWKDKIKGGKREKS